MKKIFTLLLNLIALNVSSQNKSSDTTASITLQEFVEKIKTQNESIKNVEKVNVMVNDLLIENLSEYMIDPKSVSKMEVLVLDSKGTNRGTKPSIIITTKRKK